MVGLHGIRNFIKEMSKTRCFIKLLPPSGRRAKCDDTQGDALGYELLPLQGVWGKPKGCSRISMPVLISSFSEFPPEEARWPLILALQKDPLTKGGKLCLSFL